MLNLESFRSIHIAGIGGIGVSRLARYFLFYGAKVSGSDLVASAQTEVLKKLGSQITIGKSSSLPADCQALIYSIAVPEDATDRQEAKKRGLPQLSHFEAIALIARGKQTIAIAGTNGKSTTTAMLGLIAEAAGLDPTVFVGSVVPPWQSNTRIGQGQLFIVEADELERQFLSLSPHAVVLTNIETDHLDYYRDLRDIREAFEALVRKIPVPGFFVFNHDDDVTRELVANIEHVTKIGYGRDARGVTLQSATVGNGRQDVEILLHGKPQRFHLIVPALYNVYNALAAIAAVTALGIDFSIAQKVLASYRGIWRRFEIIGTVGTTLIISDYGHHPTSIRTTMEGIRQFYPGKKILLVFQPHQQHRTQALFADFVTSFTTTPPDKLIISDIFQVAGREYDETNQISSFDLAEAISRKFANVTYVSSLEAVRASVERLIPEYDLVIFMGAGNINAVAASLVKNPTHE